MMIFFSTSPAGGPALRMNFMKRLAASPVLAVLTVISSKVAFSAALSSVLSVSSSSVYSRALVKAISVHGNALPQAQQYDGL